MPEPSMFDHPDAVLLPPELLEASAPITDARSRTGMLQQIDDPLRAARFRAMGERVSKVLPADADTSVWEHPVGELIPPADLRGSVHATIENSKVGPSTSVSYDLDPDAHRQQSQAMGMRELHGQPVDSTPTVKFTGDVELFLDRGVWNVSLTGGGLTRTVRFQPGKDSTNAKTLARLARTAIIDSAIEQMSSLFVGATILRSDESVVVQIHDITRPIMVQIEDQETKVIISVVDEEPGTLFLADFQHIKGTLDAIMVWLQKLVPAMANKQVHFDKALISALAQPKTEISRTEVTAAGVLQVLLPEGSDIGQITLTQVRESGVQLSRGILLVHPAESMLLCLDGDDLGEHASEVITGVLAERGVNTAFLAVESSDRYTYESNEYRAEFYFDSDRDTRRGYIECDYTDIRGAKTRAIGVFVIIQDRAYLVSNVSGVIGKSCINTAWKRLINREGWELKASRMVQADQLPPLFG